ncbi:MAG: hypothetical protein JJ992_09435 [Planctomycetes bacterium]|nr:hypothetical protein [Planctomycetota bacterium]
MIPKGRGEPSRGEPFQFELRHLLLFVALVSVLLAVERSMGPVPPMLAIGSFVSVVAVMLLRTENMLAGGVIGAVLAVSVVTILDQVFGLLPGWLVVTVWIFYPALGYVLGLVVAAHRSFRSG